MIILIKYYSFKFCLRASNHSKGYSSHIRTNFFWSTKSIMRELPKHYRDPVLAKFSAPQAKLKKKQAEKGVFRQFLKNFVHKKMRISGARSPLKLVYIGAKSAFRKILQPVFKNGYLKIVQRGTLWVGRWSNS